MTCLTDCPFKAWSRPGSHGHLDVLITLETPAHPTKLAGQVDALDKTLTKLEALKTVGIDLDLNPHHLRRDSLRVMLDRIIAQEGQRGVHLTQVGQSCIISLLLLIPQHFLLITLHGPT